MSLTRILALSVLALLATVVSAQAEVGSIFDRAPVPASARPLTTWAHPRKPDSAIAAYSEQRPPTFVGASPREILAGAHGPARPVLPEFMKDLARKQAKKLRSVLGKGTVEFEIWPSQDDDGWNWVFARWRKVGTADWKWLKDSIWQESFRTREPILPVRERALVPAEFRDIFLDDLSATSLYDKPVFSDCVWTDPRGKGIYGAWLAPALKESYRARLNQSPALAARVECWVIPQPARFQESAVSWVLQARSREVSWSGAINWKPEPRLAPHAIELRSPIEWPHDFALQYQDDVRTLSGEQEADFPISGRRMRFVRKSAAQSDHQLGDLEDYLAERYAVLGIRTIRERFSWRGIPESNLIAILPGTNPHGLNRPIILADHVDTAFAQDVFDRTGKRISVPGADDNDTAVAALLRAADVLRGRPHANDIWLVHLTGEEFPTDCLGARHLTQALLERGQALGGVLLMDMIGYNAGHDRLYQLSAGASAESGVLAEKIAGISRVVAPDLKAALRSRFDEKSYLYNTDGVIFSDQGYPVVLFNEHLNALENLDRPHYHESSDTTRYIDWSYATSIVQVAIQAADELAR